MDTVQCWRMHIGFGTDFPNLKPDSVYIRMIRECWRRIPQQHAVQCSPLHVQHDSVCGWVYAQSPQHSLGAIEDFQRRSCDVIRRIRGTPDAIIWEYIRVIAESHPPHQS